MVHVKLKSFKQGDDGDNPELRRWTRDGGLGT